MADAGPRLGVSFDVRWHPFFLNPALPREGHDKLEYYNRRFGEFKVRQMIPRMKAVGKTEGINFSYGGKVANSMDSHRLKEWVERKDPSKVDALIESLFAAYFEREQNIGDLDVLEACAREAGMDGARAFLESTELTDEVIAQVSSKRREWNVTGVPFFVFQDRVAFSGAQDVETLVMLMERVLKADAAAGGAGAEDDEDDEDDDDDSSAAARASSKKPDGGRGGEL